MAAPPRPPDPPPQPRPRDAAVVAAAVDVLEAPGRHRGLARILPFLGPAFVASVAYIDPGNFATNIQAGAQFGYLLCGSSSPAT